MWLTSGEKIYEHFCILSDIINSIPTVLMINFLGGKDQKIEGKTNRLKSCLNKEMIQLIRNSPLSNPHLQTFPAVTFRNV